MEALKEILLYFLTEILIYSHAYNQRMSKTHINAGLALLIEERVT